MEAENQSASMVTLLEVIKQFEWHLAVDDWFEHGSLERLVALLRENRPMQDEVARFVAAIFAGEVKHWGARGGPSIEKQRQTHHRNIGVRALFRRVLKIKQWRAKRHPEMRLDARSEARAWVSELSKGELSPDAVKKIVERHRPPLFFLMPGEAKAALAALWEQFKKKPDEVL